MKTAILSLLLVCGVALPLQAASPVRIEGNNPLERITVHIRGANVATVVKSLADRFGFKVETLGTSTRMVNGTYRGSLETVLRRILSKESFVVIRDRAPQTGHDFVSPTKPTKHTIRTVKLIGSGPRTRVIRRSSSKPNNGRRPPVTLSQRLRRGNTRPSYPVPQRFRYAPSIPRPSAPRQRSHGSES